ncbi:hypothetical protein M758_7G004900 [Ceratodon purpureus]|uniref:Uncharacterized protein n=1 Tax=Ceratodon purpureus TaxID=3225 RepID=A0A8T0H5U3_CERPU|nr:hypothetical protein KC19_7G005100 [Ceratodon purpureus]KAG0609665.1 hypothetical protein M758_7G004900 [Ceratodon purpureus]
MYAFPRYRRIELPRALPAEVANRDDDRALHNMPTIRSPDTPVANLERSACAAVSHCRHKRLLQRCGGELQNGGHNAHSEPWRLHIHGGRLSAREYTMSNV